MLLVCHGDQPSRLVNSMVCTGLVGYSAVIGR